MSVDSSPEHDPMHEVARILAIGVLRLHRRAALNGVSAIPPESDGTGLELPPDPRLSVSRRVDEF